MKAIINADDFCMREGVTNAIADAFDRRLITQTTAMVNMPYFSESIQIASNRGFFDRIGLHLNLTFGMPLTGKVRKCRRICNSDGSFSGEFHRSFMSRLYLSQEEKMALAEEIEAQMSRFVSAGLSLMHLDSHHHVHTDWSVLGVVLPLAQKFGFKTIRLSRNAGSGLTTIKQLNKAIINARIKQMFASSAYFTDVVGCKMISKIKSSDVVEIMAHPTYWQNGDFSHYVASGDMYDWHTPVCTLEALLKETKGDMELITYKDLLKYDGR